MTIPATDARTIVRFLAAQYAWHRKATNKAWEDHEKCIHGNANDAQKMGDWYEKQARLYHNRAEVYRAVITDIKNGRPLVHVACMETRARSRRDKQEAQSMTR